MTIAAALRPLAPLRALVLAVVAAAAAVVGLGGVAPTETDLVVFVVDVSASVGSPTAIRPRQLIALSPLPSSVERVAVVVYAEGAQSALPPTSVDSVPDDLSAGNLSRHGTDLEAGLRIAARVVDEAGRSTAVVVFGDGLVTQGDAAAAALGLRRVGARELDFVTLPSASPESRVLELAGPSAVELGQSFTLEARGVAVTTVAVELLESGRVVDRRSVPPGEFRVGFPRAIERTTPLRFVARVAETHGTPTTDPPPDAERVVVVQAAERTLWLSNDPPPVALDPPAEWAHPNGASTAAEARAAARIVLYDLPLDSLAPELRSTLLARVRAGATLLLVGGERQRFDADDSVSPLIAPQGGDEPVRLHLAVDGSGSMTEAWGAGGASRDATVRAAAQEWVRRADEGTRLTLRRFSERLLGPPPNPGATLTEERRAQLTEVLSAWPQPRGGTVVLPMLVEARDVLGSGRASARRLVVLSDGRTGEDGAALAGALRALRQADVDLLLLLPGTDEPSPELVAAWESAGGAIERVSGAAEVLPRFLAVERQARSRDRERAGAVIRFDVPEFGALGLPAPQAAAVPRTLALDSTEDARVLARDDLGDPVLAWRSEGLGSVVAVAGRVGDEAWWGSALSVGGSSGLGGLLVALGRSAPDAVRVHAGRGGVVAVRGNRASDCVAVRSDDGVLRSLVPDGRGGLETRFPPAAAARARWFEVLDDRGEVLATVGASRGPGAEFEAGRAVDVERLRRLVTAGSVDRPRRGPWVLLALALLVVWATPGRLRREFVRRFKVLVSLGR